jgi:DNA-binding NarL/FixJ family response regulator
MESSVRIVLAEDQRLIRAGIRALLKEVAGAQVVAETGDGREALRLIAEEQPDVVLLDISMPGLNGLEVAARVAKDFPLVRVIILSVHTAEEFVSKALNAGVSGYLLKEADPMELHLAIQSVMEGKVYLSPAVTRQVLKSGRDEEPVPELTSRQKEIVQMLAEGNSVKEIAKTLDLSVKTIETHRAQIMQRLDIHDLAGLVRYAIRKGIVEAGE